MTHTPIFFQEWYQQKHRVVDPANPILGIASACTIHSRLDVDRIVRYFEQLDIVHQWLDLVSYKLPDENAFCELMKAWEKWLEKIKLCLGEASTSTYKLFSTMIREANNAIQDSRIEAIGAYCEEMYVSKYPKYKPRKTAAVKTEMEMETADENGTTISCEELSMHVPWEEKRQKLLNSPTYLWPVGIDPEAVYVIIKIMQAEKKPETLQDFKHFVKSIGDITYVTSPKYILSNVANQVPDSTLDNEDVILNVHLGSVESKKSFQLTDTCALGNVLTFPGKQRPYKGKSFRQLQRTFGRMDASLDSTKEIFRAFQEYVLKTAKLLSQRTGATLLFDDAESNARCRDSLQEYLASLSGNNGISEEVFSKELIRRSYELSTVPADTLVKLLIASGYLTISEVDMSVTYTPGYRSSKNVDTSSAESKYLQEWERFYKQTHSEPTDVDMSASSCRRKRKTQMPLYTFRKRQRIIDI